jgi:dUTP pyrophosphatase
MNPSDDRMRPQVKIQKLYEDAIVPDFATPGSACVDLHAYDPKLKDGMTIAILPGDTVLVGCGFKMAVPPGYEAQIRARSGDARKYNITLANGIGTGDSDYRGEIGVLLHRLRYPVMKDPAQNGQPFYISQGDRIAQMKIALCPRPDFIVVKDLDATERGEGGFGSTGSQQQAAPLQTMKPASPAQRFANNLIEAQGEDISLGRASRTIELPLRDYYRALLPRQRLQLLQTEHPNEILRATLGLQDQSEWDIPHGYSHPSPISFSTAFDVLMDNAEGYDEEEEGSK